MIVQEGVEEEEENGEARELYEGPDTDILQGDAEPVTDKPRKTTKYMTKYERARVLGTRALQIRFHSTLLCMPDQCGVPFLVALVMSTQ